MLNLASPKKFAIVEYLLEHPTVTQYQVKKDLGTGMSVVNQTFKFLEEKYALKKSNGKYVVPDPEELIALLSFFRNMDKLKLVDFETSLSKQEVIDWVQKEESITFCMESALEKYSNYYITNVVSFYATERMAQKLNTLKTYKPGNKTHIMVYKEIPPIIKTETGMFGWKKLGVKNTQKIGVTPKIRTIIDLYCGKKGNTVQGLIKSLWQKKK